MLLSFQVQEISIPGMVRIPALRAGLQHEGCPFSGVVVREDQAESPFFSASETISPGVKDPSEYTE